jgi:hypothetical protein
VRLPDSQERPETKTSGRLQACPRLPGGSTTAPDSRQDRQWKEGSSMTLYAWIGDYDNDRGKDCIIGLVRYGLVLPAVSSKRELMDQSKGLIRESSPLMEASNIRLVEFESIAILDTIPDQHKE